MAKSTQSLSSSFPPLDEAVSQCPGHFTPILKGFNSQIKLAWR